MDDTKILELYFERSESAIAETARKYGAYLKHISFNILRCREDSEEIVQDSYIRAWNSIPPQRPRVLKHFLSRITRNLSLDRLEYMNAKMRSAEITELLDELENGLCSTQDSAEKEWEQRYIGELINRFLAVQGKQERSIFICRYFYALTCKEIAIKLALPEHRVRYVLMSMRAKLKNYLESEGLSL